MVKMHLDMIKTRGLDKEYLIRYLLNNTQVSKLRESLSREDRIKMQ